MSAVAYISNIGEDPKSTSVSTSAVDADQPIKRTSSGFSCSEEKGNHTTEVPTYGHRGDEDIEEARVKRALFWAKYRPLILAGVAAVIFGWWVSATILKATRHRW